MSSISYYISRKRPHSPDFRDSSDSEEIPAKKHKDTDIPLSFREKVKQISGWFAELKSMHMNRFMRMALRHNVVADHSFQEKDYDNEEESDDDELEDDDDDDVKVIDDDIQEIKENIGREKLQVARQLENLHFSSHSGCSNQLTMNGSYALDSSYNSPKLNGSNTARYIGNTNCSLRKAQTNNLKRRPLISNPPSDVEMLLGSESDVVILDDDIEMLPEPNKAKENNISPQKSVGKSLKSTSPKSSTPVLKQTQLTSVKKPPFKTFYTANEVVRLQEKAQYKLLLEKYIKESPYHHISKKPQSDVGIQADSLVPYSTSHFKKEILQQPVRNFIQKYYPPCRLLPSKKKESPEKKTKPPEITIDDDDDDEVQVVDIKLPKYKAKYKSMYFTSEWISELRENLRAQAEERNKIVEDHERKLEKYKKDRLLKRLKIDVPVEKAVYAADKEFPELTEEMEESIDRVLGGGDPEEEIIRIGSALHRKDFDTLKGLNWLNDNIINGYFELIKIRSQQEGYPSVFAFSTFFYTKLKSQSYANVKRWTKKIDLFSYDLIVVPLHLSFHWCLVVVDNRSRKICYYDSMNSNEEICLEIIHEYLKAEHLDKKGKPLDPNHYTLEIMKDIPQQMNGSDCGMFTLKYAEYITRDAEITFDQQHMSYFRRKTVYELMTAKLL